jgi:glc operon protein GlcG
LGVSGAASAAQDDEIAAFAAAEFGRRRRASAPVQHLPASQVAKAFREDATLLERSALRINASRRDGAGEAEIHQRDTDIFYVTKGSALLVTGGEVVSPRQTTAAEIRGTAIDGGQSLTIAQGDVVSIPRGTPHWFKQVRAPFEYYVVKSAAP